MEIHKSSPGYLAFDRFEVDLTSGRLLKNGRRIRLQPQPFRMLEMMLQRPGELITREEVCGALWNSDTFVEFDHSLGTAVNKIREALDDSAENPRFVETIPRRGYRFIGKLTIDPLGGAVAPLAPPRPGTDESRNVDAGKQPQTPAKSSFRRAAGLAAVLVAAALVVSVANRLYRYESMHPDSFADVQVSPFSTLPGNENSPAFSPDGSRIAFEWDGGPGSASSGYDLYVKSVGNEKTLRLTNHPSHWITPVWSPDGTQIAFHRIAGDDTGIYVVSALGGPERKLRATHAPYETATPISWSPDGKWIAFADAVPGQAGNRMFLLSPATLEVTSLPHNPSCMHEAVPTFSHRGDRLAYMCVHSMVDVEVDTALVSHWQPSRVTSFAGPAVGIAWTTDDSGVVFAHAANDGPVLDKALLRDGTLRRLSFAPSSERPTISPVGERLAYASGSGRVNIYRRDLSHPSSPAVGLSSTTREQDNPQYSPDGQHIAFASSRGGSREIWVSDADGDNLLRLSDLKGYVTRPHWSPDGKKIAFGTHQVGRDGVDRQEIFIVDVAEGVPRRIETNVRDVALPSWSHDGKFIYFTSFEAFGQKIYRCSATGGEATPLRTGRDGMNPQESPDGTMLYYASRRANTALVALSLKDGSSETVEGLPPVSSANQWLIAGAGIYFVPTEAPKSLFYFDFATGKSRQVFENSLPLAEGFSFSPDGAFLLYAQVDESSTAIMLADHFR
jgi:Tol biopolymer transport system component/DNA-binding winged helix-turn-helix (wHTH) protein